MMVFKKKKESRAEKAARLRKELEEAEREPEVPPPPDMLVKTPVQEVTSEKPGTPRQSFLEELEARYGGVFPELGPSGHAHVERCLLVALLDEVRALREELKSTR